MRETSDSFIDKGILSLIRENKYLYERRYKYGEKQESNGKE
jgi:hypothetical protein